MGTKIQQSKLCMLLFIYVRSSLCFRLQAFGIRIPTLNAADIVNEKTNSEPSSFIQTMSKSKKLEDILVEMPDSDKYEILLKSYSTQIIQGANRNVSVLSTMFQLFNEMLGVTKISTESVKAIIDASSVFSNCDLIGRSFQLSKAGGAIRAYGVGIGKLITPVISKEQANFLPLLPYDARTKEILYLGAAITIVATYSTLKVWNFPSKTYLQSCLPYLCPILLFDGDERYSRCLIPN